MREIRFGGRIKGSDRWAYGDLFRAGGRAFIVNCYADMRDEGCIFGKEFLADESFTEIDPETIIQYTGLKDKNGTAIYEGDIVYSERSGNKGEVLWQTRRAQFEVDCSVTDKYICPNDDWGDYEVIGNIYENSELLEGGSDGDN